MTIKEQVSSEIILIDLAAPVARDKDGFWGNPAIPNFDEDAAAYRDWLAAQGIETMFDCLDVEDDDHPAYINYYDLGGTDISEWECSAPAGEGWHTFSIHDSEDGPCWVWARRAAGLDAAGIKRAMEGQP